MLHDRAAMAGAGDGDADGVGDGDGAGVEAATQAANEAFVTQRAAVGEVC